MIINAEKENFEGHQSMNTQLLKLKTITKTTNKIRFTCIDSDLPHATQTYQITFRCKALGLLFPEFKLNKVKKKALAYIDKSIDYVAFSQWSHTGITLSTKRKMELGSRDKRCNQRNKYCI